MRDLAEKLNTIMKEYDPWGYRDAEYSVEQALYDIENSPEKVIDGLLDMLDVKMENDRATVYGVRTNSYNMASNFIDEVNEFTDSINEPRIPMQIRTEQTGIVTAPMYPKDVDRFKSASEYVIECLWKN